VSFLGYSCSLCGTQYSANEAIYICPRDGGNLDVTLDMAAIRRGPFWNTAPAEREPSLWRYLPLLPVSDPGGLGTPLRAAGWTPTYAPPLLARQLGVR
jgi:threonine synthase